MSRGEIRLCDFGTPVGHEAGFRRPALVVSPGSLNRHGVLVVLPITRTRLNYPTHVELDGALPVVSYVQCELIRSISDGRVVRPLGVINEFDLARVDLVLRRILGLR